MKNKKLGAGTKLAIFMLIISIIVMFILLGYSSKLKRAKVNDIKDTTTTVQKVDNPDQIPTDDKEINAKSFKASLADVLYGNDLVGNYKVETYYSGAKFNFNCTSYKNDKCESGSALINTGKIALPLYTYDKEEDNYINHLSDYYIIYTDNYLILTFNHVAKTPGKIRIYDKEGNKLSEINNVITGYVTTTGIEDQLYPNLKDDKLSYYSCNNNKVIANTVNINNPGIAINKNQINSVKCY